MLASVSVSKYSLFHWLVFVGCPKPLSSKLFGLLLSSESQDVAVSGSMYLATTAVVMQEVMKLFVCLFILWRERGFDVPATLQFLKVRSSFAPLPSLV